MIEFYFKSVIRRWKNEIKNADSEIIIMSPFLTSKTAENVLLQAPPSHCSIYTNFNLESFASGASSIKTIKKLLQLGYKIYHLDQLHAKILYIPDSFISIGSQNLTHGGTIKKEATLIISKENEINMIEPILSDWISERLLINSKMIERVEIILPNLRKSYLKFKKQMESIDEYFQGYINSLNIHPKINNIKNKINEYFINGSVPESLARRFIANSAWWLTHFRGPVRAPGHSSNMYGQGPNWKIDFGANTFLVGKALLRCVETVLKFLSDIENEGLQKSKEELRNSLIYDIRSSVSNFEGIEYDLYSIDGQDIKFGAQSIDVKDFTDLIFEIFDIDTLFNKNDLDL